MLGTLKYTLLQTCAAATRCTLRATARAGSLPPGACRRSTKLRQRSVSESKRRAVQVALYGLLLEARYGVDPLDGLLWYSSDEAMERKTLKPQDIAGALRCNCLA